MALDRSPLASMCTSPPPLFNHLLPSGFDYRGGNFPRRTTHTYRHTTSACYFKKYAFKRRRKRSARFQRETRRDGVGSGGRPGTGGKGPESRSGIPSEYAALPKMSSRIADYRQQIVWPIVDDLKVLRVGMRQGVEKILFSRL